MDVRCARCRTEYEFDDALISERGTTVKCTNCGHQFKVYPPRSGGGGVPERWVVRTRSGRELVYTSLKDLQKGIGEQQVGRDDLLSRGNQVPRPLGSIAELEPFFRDGGKSFRQPNTLAGVAPPANAPAPGGPAAHPAIRAPAPASAAASASAQPTAAQRAAAQASGFAPSSDASRTLASDQAAPQTQRMSDAPRSSGTDPFGNTHPDKERSIRHGPLPEPGDLPTLPRNAKPEPPPVAPIPSRDVAIREAPVQPLLTPTPSDVRESYESNDVQTESQYLPGPHGRRAARSRWIVGLVLVGLLVLLGATVGRKYIARFTQPPEPTASAPVADDRVATMLEKGRELLDEGDFEAAKEQLDKATVLADEDPAVLAALAKLEVARADIEWLRLRLLDPTKEDLVQATHRQLGYRVGKTEQAVEKARAVAPKNPDVQRARIDTLRLEGKVAEARGLIEPISQDASKPANAYVLAALDLAEPEPVWSSIIDRLRTASSGEGSLGRARAALVYALVRAGQMEDARSELSKIEAQSTPHPLLAELTSFVERFEAAAGDAGADAEADVAAVDPAALGELDISGAGVGEPTAAGGDFRMKLRQASSALQGGNLSRAESLYNAVLAEQPGNTEALSGLAEVARRRNDPEGAARMYDKVLEKNPSYLPALSARADQKWASGDKAGAVTLYRRILSQAGPGTSYGQRAASRIAEYEASGASQPEQPAPAPDSAPAPAPEPAPAPAPEPDPDQPHIDTTDLPGFNQ